MIDDSYKELLLKVFLGPDDEMLPVGLPHWEHITPSWSNQSRRNNWFKNAAGCNGPEWDLVNELLVIADTTLKEKISK